MVEAIPLQINTLENKTKPHTDRAVTIYLSLSALGLLIAAISGAALTWDGSYILFKILDQQAPYVDHSRWYVVALQWPIVLASHFTTDLSVLQTLFGLVYAVVPLLSLILCWWVVRDKNRSLFVWAAFGIGLITLPGQISFISDASMTLQLFWPIVLAILSGLSRPQLVMVVILSLIAFFGHPVAIVLFGVAAALCFVVGLSDKTRRRIFWYRAMAFGGLAITDILKFSVLHTNYEGEQLSLDEFIRQFNTAVLGLPLVAVIFMWLAAALVFMQAHLNPTRRTQLLGWLRIFEWISLIIVGGLLVIWAKDPHLWETAIDFRIWATLFSFPIIVLAAVEEWFSRGGALESGSHTWIYRSNTIKAIGLIFLLVITVQSTVWANLSNRLSETINQNEYSCISTNTLGGVDGTALQHWSITPYSLLLSGSVPHKVILNEAGCADNKLAQSLPLAAWDSRVWNGGQINLQPLNQKLLAEQQTPPDCRFFMATGWYSKEQNDTTWWRWNDGTGKVEIFSDKNRQVMLSGSMKSFQQPNQVDIIVNGQNQTSIAVTWDDSRAFTPLAIQLKTGQNEVSFVSHNPAVIAPDNKRSIAVLVGGINLTNNDNIPLCKLQN